jgi:hypothetical protein
MSLNCLHFKLTLIKEISMAIFCGRVTKESEEWLDQWLDQEWDDMFGGEESDDAYDDDRQKVKLDFTNLERVIEEIEGGRK